MATQLAASTAAGLETAAPFMLSPAPVDADFAAAVRAAAVAEDASHDVRRNTRCRVSYFLCELANQLRQRREFDFADELPLSRYDIAAELDISLCKVKRVLALLSLSGVLSTDGRSLQVLDWQRLCAVAHVDPARLSLSFADDDDDLIVATEIEEPVATVTAGGEQACFV
jgi:hypothetical protein